MNEWKPFKYALSSDIANLPEITGINNIQRIAVFDEEIVTQVLTFLLYMGEFETKFITLTKKLDIKKGKFCQNNKNERNFPFLIYFYRTELLRRYISLKVL